VEQDSEASSASEDEQQTAKAVGKAIAAVAKTPKGKVLTPAMTRSKRPKATKQDSDDSEDDANENDESQGTAPL
jgi:hypothetical protein